MTPITGKLERKPLFFFYEEEVRNGNLGTRFWTAKYEMCIETQREMSSGDQTKVWDLVPHS